MFKMFDYGIRREFYIIPPISGIPIPGGIPPIPPIPGGIPPPSAPGGGPADYAVAITSSIRKSIHAASVAAEII